MIIFLLGISLVACVKAPDYPIEPVITYEGINKTEVWQGSANLPLDTLAIFMSFTDGDGDLSIQDTTDIFLYDSRFPSIVASIYKLPAIPEEGTGNGLRGDITIQIVNTNGICCIENGFVCPNNPAIAQDTFSYEIQIRDRAGNLSNKIRTETIRILCR
ncbi:MAG: hypothetical protein R2795_18680 [Saprospiraceae bacterium]